jgi:hypothetical protein|tara:strand:- start:2333 stop:2731 length:399 start_codon:yes stop_codon:yes gene_type:complete
MANKKKRFWFIDTSTTRARMGIAEQANSVLTKDGYTTDFKAITEVKDITIYAIARDYDLTVNNMATTWSQIPIQFHEVIVNKAIANGYKEPRNMDIQVAQYFDNEYLLGLKEAKKFSRSNYQTTGNIKPQDF